MPQNPLRFAHREAEKNDKFLKDSFARYLGNSEHPRGKILSIYRTGRSEMRSALKGNIYQVPIRVRDVLSKMRNEVKAVASLAVNSSVLQGSESAQRQVNAYIDAGAEFEPALEQPDRTELIDGFMSAFDKQSDAIAAMVGTGAYDETRIIGDQSRLGLLQPNPIVVNGTEWIATALNLALLAWWVGRDREPKRETDFEKQAIAVVDGDTTNTCLNVNGQVRKFNKKFKLSPHTPRFADNMLWSPFHWQCRTTIALYLASFDFGITAEIERASQEELQRRAEQK